MSGPTERTEPTPAGDRDRGERERLVIAGGPRTGKTTAAMALQERRHWALLSTDALIHQYEWSQVSEIAATWFDHTPAPFILEGVAAARALRKWLASHPTGAPCDRIIVMTVPVVMRTREQETMAKGCDTVWAEIEPELRARDVTIHGWDPDTGVVPQVVPWRAAPSETASRADDAHGRDDVPGVSDSPDIRHINDDVWFR